MKYAFLLLLVALFAHSSSGQTQRPGGPSAPQDFAAVAMDGTKVDTSTMRGKIVVLNLWFINCPNCIEEIKLLNQLVDEYKGKADVVFLAPAASRKMELDKFLKKHPFKYQVVPDAGSIILSKFGTPNKKGEMNMPFPMHVMLDRTGKVVVSVQGIRGVEAVRAELKRQFK